MISALSSRYSNIFHKIPGEFATPCLVHRDRENEAAGERKREKKSERKEKEERQIEKERREKWKNGRQIHISQNNLCGLILHSKNRLLANSATAKVEAWAKGEEGGEQQSFSQNHFIFIRRQLHGQASPRPP